MSGKTRPHYKYYLLRNSLEKEEDLRQIQKKGFQFTKSWHSRLIKLAKYYKNVMRKSKNMNLFNFRLDSRFHRFKLDKSSQLLHFLQNQKQLKRLELEFETNILDKDSIEDSGITAISYALLKLKKLKSCNADFKRCDNIGNPGLCQFFRSISFCSMLERLSLNLTGINSVTQAGFKIISKSIAKLRVLNSISINLSWTKVKNPSLQELINEVTTISNLKSIELHIESCHSLESKGFAALFQPFKNMYKFQHFKLNMKSCVKIDEIEIHGIFGILSCLDQLKTFMVNLTWCNLRRVNFPGIMTITKGFINLRDLELNFRGCLKIDKDEISTLENEAKTLQRIKTITIFSY